MTPMRLRPTVSGSQARQRQIDAAQRWGLRIVALGSAAGLLMALGAGAAVLAHPPLFAELRPWWPPLAAVGLLSTAAGYWLLWGRGR